MNTALIQQGVSRLSWKLLNNNQTICKVLLQGFPKDEKEKNLDLLTTIWTKWNQTQENLKFPMQHGFIHKLFNI